MEPTIENPTPELDDDDCYTDTDDYGMAWTGPVSEKRQQLVAEILERFPEHGHRTLARTLHEKHELLFPSLEIARSALRHHTGNGGSVSRDKAKREGRDRPPRKPGELPPLPESSAQLWTPFVIDTRRTLCLSDIHLRFHDPVAIKAALRYGDKFNPDTILLNGDVFDFYQVSRFDKDPTKPKVVDELTAGKQLFDHLRQRFRKAQIVFRYGNHDRRFDLYLMRAAPAIFDVPGALDVWHEAAGIKSNGVTVVREQRPVMLGKLPVFHGDELPNGGSAVNPARGAFLRTMASLLQSHLHRTSEHTERSLDGRVVTCRTMGCLCGLYPDYARINKWDSGFATVEVASDGNYECELKRIIDGKVY